jgi:hypothetical protein
MECLLGPQKTRTGVLFNELELKPYCEAAPYYVTDNDIYA